MFNKALKTYERKKNGKLNYSSLQSHSSTIGFNHVKSKKTKRKETLNDTLNDPFDTTFDRLLRDVGQQRPPPPISNLSYVSSSAEFSDGPSTPKTFTPDSRDDSVFEKVPKKKPRLKKQKSKAKSPKAKKPPRLVKKKAAVKTEVNKAKKSTTQNNEKKTDQQKLKLPIKRKRRRIYSDSENSLTDFVSRKKPNISENSYKTDLSVLSNNILKMTSILHTPDSINSSIRAPDDNNVLKNTHEVQKTESNSRKSGEKSKEFSPAKESLCSKRSFSPIRSFHSNKTDSVRNCKSLPNANLKMCSVILEPCDWMLKKKEIVVKLKPCSIQIPRLKISPYLETDEPSIDQLLEKEAKRASENKTVRKPEEESRNEQTTAFEKNDSIAKINKETCQVDGSPIFVRDCVVSLSRIKPLKNSFSRRLISSTPFVKGRNENLLAEFSPMEMEISNIKSTPDFREIPQSSKEFSFTPRRNNDPSVQSKNNNNLQRSFTSKPVEFEPSFGNYSSEYSEIDWTTVSFSESQFPKEQEKQNPPLLGKEMSASKSISSVGTKEDLSATKELLTSKLDASTKPFNFVTKRNLNLNSEYEKSTSMFDDTQIYENNSVPSLRKISPVKLDETFPKSSPISSPKKYSPLKENPPSIMDESDFMGFENVATTMPYLKKLSPMTSIPTKIVYSLSYEDSKKSVSVDEDSKLEKSKFLRSLAFEESVKGLGLKSPRKCLNFEEEPKIPLHSISSNKETFNEESVLKGSFDESFSQESSNKNTFSQASSIKDDQELSIEEDCHLKLKDSSSSSSLKIEDSQFSVVTESIILLEDGKDEISDMKNVSLINLEGDSQISFDQNESQKTVNYEDLNTPQANTQTIMEDEVEKQNSVTEAVNTSEIKLRESIISLHRLKDPIRITDRRKKYRNWGLELAAISENDSGRVSENKIKITAPVDDVLVDPIQEDVPSICDTVSLASSLNISKDVEIPELHLFLKPGKSWARSLSILNNIHSKDDMDKHSVGKGKKWRNSVISILDMQSQGIAQSCFKKQEDPKSPQPSGILTRNPDYDSKFDRLSTLGSISPNRFVKRISIRVVPDAKKIYSNVEDTQFLEAYGITSSQSQKTLSQRFSSLEENNHFVATQESLVYNVQLEDSVIKTVDSSQPVTAKDVVLERCHQEDYLPFAQCYPEKFLKHCRKIGEGVYGEVFLHDNESDISVIKIIPIEGKDLVNGEPQKKFNEILSEIVIAKELHDLRFNETYNTSGFVEVKSIKCIIGRYPPKLIELWKTFDNEKKSENDCPSMFGDNQLYISLELGHGGQDLEAFVFQNAKESYAVFIQTAFALAVAEKKLEFEHRDMHWGNVLISRTKKSKVSYKLGNREINFAPSGVKVAIIDFTLSRMSYQGCCIFSDLALDPALFTAEGEYQFEIYRLMRDKINNDWQTFEPFTNILWLHYTLDKMIKLVRYKKKTTKVHKTAIERLTKLKDEILSYDSAYDLVTKCDTFTSLYDDVNSSTFDSENKSL